MIGISNRMDDVVSWYRALEESDLPRAYFEFEDLEGVVEEGARALYEAVEHEGELIVIRQIELPTTGGVHRYSWRLIEDVHGGLVDEPIDPHEDPVKPISRQAFDLVWNSGAV